MGVDPAPEALWNAELELHPVLVTRLAHWGQKGVKWCEAEVREQKCDHILDNRQQTHLLWLYFPCYFSVWLNTNKNISRPPECGFVLAYNRGKTLEHIGCCCRRVWLASVTPHNTLGYHQDIPQHPLPGHRNPILPIYPSHSHPSRKNPYRSAHNCSCSCSCLPP